MGLFELSGAIHILDLLYVIVAHNVAVSEDHLWFLHSDGGPVRCGAASMLAARHDSYRPVFIWEKYRGKPDHTQVSLV